MLANLFLLNISSVQRMVAYTCLYCSVLKLKNLDLVKNVDTVKCTGKIKVLMQQTGEEWSNSFSLTQFGSLCNSSAKRGRGNLCVSQSYNCIQMTLQHQELFMWEKHK